MKQRTYGHEEHGEEDRGMDLDKMYKSEAFAAIHETMEALHEIGAIDKEIMLQFDVDCLNPVQDKVPEE